MICYPYKRQFFLFTVSYGGITMSKRRKIKAEEKIRIVKACAKGTISLNATAEQLGIHQSVVDAWVCLYQTEGIDTLLPRDANRRYDSVVKEAAVKDYLSGRDSLRGICKIYKIRSTSQLMAWIIVGVPCEKGTG